MKKILVTVGNDTHPFHRLIEKVDEVSKGFSAEFIVQFGHGGYLPKNIKKASEVLEREEFYKKFSEADLVVAHAGIGNMIDAVTYKKKMIVVPRQKKFEEHFNDHQMEIAKEIDGKYNNIKVLYEIDRLGEEIDKMLEKETVFPEPPNLKQLGLVKEIKEFIENEK